VEKQKMTFVAGHADSSRAKYSSDLVLVNGLGFLSGLGPIDLKDDKVPLPEGVEAQMRQIFKNLDAILAASKMDRGNVVSVRINLTNFERLHKRVDAEYLGAFPATKSPARSLVGVSHLPRGTQIEMDFIVSEAKP
jgi:2-iminobutanoate/2-iminopropanoate deaminase